MVASKSKARKPTPLPGQPVRGSTSGRPVMALLDLLGRRWALRVLWELRDGGGLTFRELQARCAEVSSSVLNDRLRELREAGIVQPHDIDAAVNHIRALRHVDKLTDVAPTAS